MKEIPLKNAEERILSLAQYPKAEPKSPFILNLKNKEQELFLYGCKHSKNIRNKQFKDIEKHFNYFLQNNRNVAIIIEGHTPNVSSKDELVKKYGETGFVFYMSQKNKIKIYEIEPSWDQLLKFATKRNSEVNVASWILLNNLNSRIKMGNKFDEKTIASIKSLIHSIDEKLHLTKMGSAFGIISNNLMNVTGKSVLPENPEQLTDFDLDSRYIFKLQNPFSTRTVLNKVGTDINLGRDYFLSKNILSLLKKNKSVFGVIGLNHVFCTKDIFEDFFKKRGTN
ncbi:hypothetical protein A2524_02045 [Candidatus Wolfebacteria bacterium RIFOXYD12_FULL_48_21]|nr:MAG: hypothetical protein A2524_02045 [Candidatus Wolfebacteria bacterium RIFOXYD12_FULL_48_21]OGM95679.1 MAG: hypothetical protein A2532_02855 [Candidatus Wolfebacteria bacterium RIFOXYD2_FULL_48_11]